MAVKITGILPKISPRPNDSVLAHLSVEFFQWINDQTQQSGVSSRSLMFDWIVNKKGIAYIKKDDKTLFVFGANAPTGQYIRALEGTKWTDDLLDVPEFRK